jgi:hypothetical protein
MVQAIYRMIAQADGSLMLARRGIGAAQSLIERAGFFDGPRISQSRSGSPGKRVEDLTPGAGWLLSTDDCWWRDAR